MRKREEENLANIEPRPLVKHEGITSSISTSEIEEVILNQIEPLVLTTILPVEETKEETTTPDISTVSLCLFVIRKIFNKFVVIHTVVFLQPDIEIIEPTPEDIDQTTALVLATLTLVSIYNFLKC